MNRLIRKTAFWAVLLFLFPSFCYAADVASIRHSTSPEKIRIVLELSEESSYETSHENDRFSLLIRGSGIKEGISGYRVMDAAIESFDIRAGNGSVNIEARINASMESKVFILKEPPRIVIDFFRPGTQESEVMPPPPVAVHADIVAHKKYLVPNNKITDGLSYYEIEEIVHDNIIRAKSFLVDLKKLEVMPVMAVSQLKPKNSGDAIGSVLSFLGFAPEQQVKYSHFARRTVASFLKMYDGIAGVNGSFFFADGTPVGTLIINKQIVSSPLFNRTSLIFYENGTAAIDSVRMTGYLKLKDGEKLAISGINQPMNGGIIVYTPDYQKTGYSGSSVNISVVDGKAEQVSYGEIAIPKNGFVVSAAGASAKSLTKNIRPGDAVEWFFMTRPAMKGMKHIVAGGPRLVHSGKPCVTSKEENFRSDVARSRANRTAAGIKKTGDLILLTVEKATLNELARLMIELGAYDAMNLDGGGSSGMVAAGKTLFGGSRPVSNAIIVKNK